MPQTELITGITGQDGAYLAEFLLNKGYIVHGIQRRTSGPNTARIHNILNDINLHYSDMTDGLNITKIIHDTKPDEIYNLAAQSDVAVSFDTPEYTANTDALGPLRLLEAIRILNPQIRFYQASSSELFGNASSSMQDENTPFQPQSPYACAKLYAYWTVVNYRDAYGLHACNGICFNHESPLRGEEFVTQKICAHIAAMEQELTEPLRLGNLNAKRDWGHARDYIRGMWMMLQAENPDDYVLATGQTRTVREFVEHAFKYAGKNIQWQGIGINEQGMDAKTGKILVTVDPKFYRPNEVHTLCGHAKKIEQDLGWQPEIPFEDLLVDMMRSALRNS